MGIKGGWVGCTKGSGGAAAEVSSAQRAGYRNEEKTKRKVAAFGDKSRK